MRAMLFFSIMAALVLSAGCASPKISSEDIEVPVRFKNELEILHSTKYRANSREKYEAAMTLFRNIDFSFTRTVDTLDTIFTTLDATVNKHDKNEQNIIFTYQYENKFVRFIFARSGDRILRSEVTTEKDIRHTRSEGSTFLSPTLKQKR